MDATLSGLSLDRQSTPDAIAERVRRLILDGDIEPGEAVREADIAARFSVARNSVREALRQLESGPLLRRVLNRGSVVRNLDPDALSDSYRARSVIEAAVARDAAGKPTAQVRDAFAGIETAARMDDPASLVRADLAFHSAIVGLLQNPRLDALYRELVDELEFSLVVLARVDPGVETPEDVVREHRQILRLLERQELSRLESVLTDHIEASRARVVRIASAH